MTVQQHVGGAVLKREQQCKNALPALPRCIVRASQSPWSPSWSPSSTTEPQSRPLLLVKVVQPRQKDKEWLQRNQRSDLPVLSTIHSALESKIILEHLVDKFCLDRQDVGWSSWTKPGRWPRPRWLRCQKSRYPHTQYNRISTLDILMPMTTCYLLSSMISYNLVIIENCFIIKWKREFWEERGRRRC